MAYRKSLAYRTSKLYRALGPGVLGTGWLDEQFGTAAVKGRNLIAPVGIAPTSVVYHPYVAFYFQFVFETAYGWLDEHFGATTIQIKTRYVYPTGWFEEHIGTGTAIQYRIQPAPLGWLDEQVPRAHVDIHFNNIRPAGWVDDHVSLYATIQWSRRSISFFGQIDERFGTPGIVNRNRFIYERPQGYPDDVVPTNAVIVNRNRVMRPASWQDDRFNFFDGAIRNAGRALLEAGWKDETFGAGTFIAYKNRPLPLHGWVDESFGNNVPANLAWGIYPPSIPKDEHFGSPRIVNTRRFLHLFGIPSTDAVGTPFVSFRVRYLVESAGSHPDEVFGYNTQVQYNPRRIYPAGWIDSDRHFGWPEVFIHSHNLSPRPITSLDIFGLPYIANRNRTLFVPSPDLHEAFGTTRVELRTRHLYPPGLATEHFGASLVQWSTRYIHPYAFSIPPISTYHRISESVEDGPPEDKNVYPASWDDTQYGVTATNIHGVFASGWLDEHIGAPVAHVNTIDLNKHSIINLLQIGTPTLTYTRGIFPTSIPPLSPLYKGDSDLFTKFTLPRIDPFHIYAPAGDRAPPGYTPDYLTAHPMDYLLGTGYDNSRWPRFGQQTVTNQNRAVYVPSISPPFRQVSFAAVDWKTHYVYPAGIKQWRIGLVRFLNVPQYINFDTYHFGLQEEAFGTATIGPIPDYNHPVIPSLGLDERFGNNVIELQNRPLPVPSIWLGDHFGTAVVGTDRYYALTGWLDENLIWTSEFVSYKIRHLNLTGFVDDSFARIDDDPIWFDSRTRVANRSYVIHDKGFESTKFGKVVVKGGHECCNNSP